MVSLLLKYYSGFDLDSVLKLTFRQCGLLLDGLNMVMELENPKADNKKKDSLEGAAAAAALSRIFPGKVKKREPK